VDKNADGRIGEEEVKEVSNKHCLCLELVVVQYEQFLSLFFLPFRVCYLGTSKSDYLGAFDGTSFNIWPIELSNSKPLPQSYLLLFF
jgi:hypothetical protein